MKLIGIDFIIDQYTKVKSAESKENLFAILFDYVVHTLSTNKQLDDSVNDPFAIILECMRYILSFIMIITINIIIISLK